MPEECDYEIHHLRRHLGNQQKLKKQQKNKVMIKIKGGQDSANNSTPLPYWKNNRRFVNYSCMNLSKKFPSYLTRVLVEYLHFRRIWLISQIFPRFSRVTGPEKSSLFLVPPIREMMSSLILSRFL